MRSLQKSVIRLLLADRDDLVREGVRSVLSRISAGVLIDEVRTFMQLVEALSSRKYDLVIVEPIVIGNVGVDIIKHMQEVAPTSKILIFTQLNELTHGARSISYGAKGFLMKDCSAEDFLTAVRWVQKGRIYVGAALANQFATSGPHRSEHSPYDSLTKKEKLVYSMLVCGMRVVEIAKKLNLSQKTVSTHKSRILSKFRFQSFIDLLNYTVVYGLIDECRSMVERYINVELDAHILPTVRPVPLQTIQLSSLLTSESIPTAGCPRLKSHCAFKSACE